MILKSARHRGSRVMIAFLCAVVILCFWPHISGTNSVYAAVPTYHPGEPEAYDDYTAIGPNQAFNEFCHVLYHLGDSGAYFIDLSDEYPEDHKFNIPVTILDNINCAFYTVLGIQVIDEGSHQHPALSGNQWVKEVTFDDPSYVEYIGPGSFKNSALEKIALPALLSTIGASAFEGSALSVITLPQYVDILGDRVFAAPGLTKIIFTGANPPSLGTGGTKALAGLAKKGLVFYPAGADYSSVIAALAAETGQQWKAEPYTNINDAYSAKIYDDDGSVIGGGEDEDTEEENKKEEILLKSFASAPVPTITGIIKVGKTLTAQPGSWTPGTSFAYQWLEDGKVINGATNADYTLTSANLGKKISVNLTGSKEDYASVTNTSKETSNVIAEFKKTGKVTISGTARVGKTLKSKPGTWSPKAKLSYQWYANGKAIKGATKSTLKLKKAQKGKTITVKVTGKKTWYQTVTKKSKATGKVKK